ncbi:MAG: ABC transporter permease [Clostridia bacterium]|nr:ABC transporter permease [Clostridia bacterium]
MAAENKQALAGMIIMGFFLIMLLVLTRVFPYDSTPDPYNILAKPSGEHLLGTDELGRDLMRRLIAGSRSVLSIAFLTGLFTVTIGVVLGMVSGLLGGWADKLIMLVTNLFMTVPTFPIMLVLAQVTTITDTVLFSLLLSVFSWAGLCRAIRSQIVSVKERDFIQICKVMNLSKAHIIFSELFPNIASYVVVNFIMIMRSAITASVGIMMLGVVAYDHTNWGAVLNSSQIYIMNPDALLFWLSPILFIVVFQTGVILLANGLDVVLNPRLRNN